MKTARHQNDIAAIHDYASGAELAREMIDWEKYYLWAEGLSQVCAAWRCLTTEQINRLGITLDTTIFCIEV